jgi:hypothetical protein
VCTRAARCSYTGTLTAHTTGEQYPLTMVEIHQVEDGTVRKIDVYTKNPDEAGTR